MRIFISYSRKDMDAANALSAWLEARGADVSIDYQEILGTDHFPPTAGTRDRAVRCTDQRVIRGGDFLTFNPPDYLASATRLWSLSNTAGGSGNFGFRYA